MATASQNDSDLDDLDSDLSSIRSELTRNESIQIAEQDATTSSASLPLPTVSATLPGSRESREEATKQIIALVTALREKVFYYLLMCHNNELFLLNNEI